MGRASEQNPLSYPQSLFPCLMSPLAPGSQVSIHYTGTLTDGAVFDSSQGREPLQFVIGQGQVIPGFEAAVQEMAVGDRKTVTIPCQQAYGPHHPDQVMVLDRQQFPTDLPLDVGLQLQLQGPQGQAIPVLVTCLSDTDVTLDANHPLAGEDLTFELELVAVN